VAVFAVMDDFVMAKELPGLTALRILVRNKPSSRKVRPENHPDASDKTV